ncbi:MAG: toxic anion resistance protein [Clostridia bacterium]|nr:toxic anion resistance protein [Clostridia bacterium]
MEELVLNVNNDDVKVDEVEKELLEKKRLTDEEVERSLNFESLSDKEKEAITEFNKKVDIKDTNQILTYGINAQKKISQFSDSVISNVRTKSVGEVGDLLTDLVCEIRDFDSTLTPDTKGIFAIFNSVKKQFNKIIAKYDKVGNNIEKIERQLETHKLQMLKDIAIFDTMYEKNIESFKELSLYVIAGEEKIKEIKEKELPALVEKAKETGEQLDAQAVNDLNNMLDRFEKKIYDLKTTRVIAVQMAPQIRMIQNNDSELVQKIQSSIINTIPLWKNQIVIALGLANSKAALNAQKGVTDITNELLQKNSENLKQGTIEVAKQSEEAIVNIETLKKTNQDILTTLDEMVRIHSEGRARRAQNEQELLNIESELKSKLIEIKVQNDEANGLNG